MFPRSNTIIRERINSCLLKLQLLKQSINLLNPTGYVMHHQFNIHQLYVLPTLYVFCIYLRTNSDLCHLRA